MNTEPKTKDLTVVAIFLTFVVVLLTLLIEQLLNAFSLRNVILATLIISILELFPTLSL